METNIRVEGLFVGAARERWPGRPPSAIGKSQTDGPLDLTHTGFSSDQQADLAVHGGPDKALHHYASDHYAFWQTEKPHLAAKLVPGGLGENLSTFGLTETDVCIGDVFSLGTAQVQISQGRQPCWKLNMHLGDDTLAARFQKTGRTGWYYRVLETGVVCLGDRLTLQARPQPAWPLNAVIAARFDPKVPAETAAQLAALPELADNWRKSFAKKADPAYREDTSARLLGS